MPGNVPNRLEELPNLMLSSLPPDASPQLRNPYDAVALFSHAAMLSIDFRLVGLGEDHSIPAESSGIKTKPLPAEWNSTNSSSYAFRYKHSQSSMEFLIKVSRLGKKAIVNALAIGDDKVHGFDIAVDEFLSGSSFPYTAPSQPADTAAENSGPRVRSMTDLFISAGRIGDLWALFKINITQRIAPGLGKGGDDDDGDDDDIDAQRQADEETRTYPPGHGPAARNPTRPRQPGQPDPLRDDPPPPYRPFPPGHDPLAPEQAYPRPDREPMPGFDDDYDILRVPGRGGGGPRRPNLGDRDLYPQGLGPNDPFRPSGPVGLGGFGGGGMHPTRDDFLGMGQFGDDGSDAFGAPPGARFDPPFPGMGPPRGGLGGGPRGFGGPGGLGGPGGGGFGGFGGGGII